MSCQHIPELFSVKYLRRESVPLAVSPSSLLPHEVPHLLHPGGRNVYCLKLNAPCLQNRAYRLLLGGYLWTKISLNRCCRDHKERHFTFAFPELPLMNTLMAMFKQSYCSLSLLYLSCVFPPSYETGADSGITNVDTDRGRGSHKGWADPESGSRLGDDTMT